MMKKILLALFVLCLALPVNAKKTRSQDIITPMTQLEKRQFQTRTYDSTDKALVMKAMLNVLQDEGFIVYNANPLLGFIYGVKDFDTSDSNIDISKDGKDIMIGFNPKFLMDALKVIDDETIDIYMVNPKAPCIIRDSSSSYLYLILPVNFTV